MANAARGEIALKLGGKSYTLRPSFGAICEIEDALGASIFELGRRLERAEITARELLKLTQACLLHSGHAVKEDELGASILEHGALEAIAGLAKFCQAYAFGGQEEKKAGAPSTPSPAATAPTTSAPT